LARAARTLHRVAPGAAPRTDRRRFRAREQNGARRAALDREPAPKLDARAPPALQAPPTNYREWPQRVLLATGIFGYYADPVDEGTATLPAGWKARLINLPPGDTEGVSGLCLDPHDLAIAKYVAGREKDIAFNRALAERGIVTRRKLLQLLEKTRVAETVRARIRHDLANDFAASK
jgi:hypothetical protein